MPSPATRSGRLIAKQSQEEKESKDVADKKTSKTSPSPSKPLTKTKKSSGNKSPKLSQNPKETSLENIKRSKQNTNPTETEKNVSPKDTQDQQVKEVALSEQLESEVPLPDVSVAEETDLSDNSTKKIPSSPASTSTLRRSRRAPVPSSRFKDMELGMTPNSQKMKRSMGPSGDSDGSGEPTPKRSKKNSTKSSEMSQNVSENEGPTLSSVSDDKECNLAQESHVKDAIGTSIKRNIEEKKNENVELNNDTSPDETNQGSETQVVKSTPSRKELDITAETPSRKELDITAETPSRKELDITAETPSRKQLDITVETPSHNVIENEIEAMEVLTTQPDGLNTDGLNTKDSMNEIVMSTASEELSFENDISISIKNSEQNTFLSPDLSVNSSSEPMEATSQEITVEEVGLSCHDAGIIVEETVHTYMDEKDVVVIQNSDIIENCDSTEETSTVHTPKKLELSLDKESSAAISSSIMIKGQEVTVQERDGKMVAIVKIPSKFSSHFTSPSESEMKEVAQSEKITEEEYPMSSSLKNITLNATSSQKSRHGYILNKKTEKQFLTVSDQDQNTLNISLEPATMSSILKSKSDSLGKATPKSLYGRVIKQEPLVTKANAETLLVQSTSPSNLLVKNAGSNQVSLLSHSIKATNPKDSKPYSLLSSPSELLQKLKSDSEKKQASKIMQESKKGAQLPSPPKKVVIITHPPKSDAQVEKASVSSLIINPPKEDIIQVESGQGESIEPTQTDSTVALMDSGMESNSQSEQNDLPQIQTTDVVEKVATDNEFVGISNKVEVEGIVVHDIFPNHENAELTVLQGKDQNPTSDLSLDKHEPGNEVISGIDESKTKELTIDSVVSYSESREGEDNVTSDLMITHDDKSAVEETVITSSAQTEVVVKQELGLGTEDLNENKTVELITVGEKGKSGETNAPKTQKIKLVDNGVVYELQIVSEGENRSFQDDTIELEGVDGEAGMIVKQEIIDDGESTSNETVGKSSLGTQTIFTSKRGRPRASDDKEDADSPVHKLTTIVQEGGQKKHYYYVSVVPGKTMDGKYRRSVDHSLPGCVVNEEGEYCCKECDYKTDKKANFYKHRRLHTGSKPHVCHVCKYQARTSSNLKRHMGIHEDIREFKCNQCSLSFRQKIHLERHIRYRHEEKRVKCPMCDYVCANEQPDLKMHIKRKHTHESGKVYSCPQCNIEVGSKRDLKQHLKFHKEGPELKLFCKECSFVTDCKSRLQRHLVVHSNVKPYHCGVCDYKATQKEHVVRHLRSQHKIEVNKPKRPWKKQIKQEASETLGGNSRGDFTCGDKIFACNHCTMRFAKLINLYKHLHTQHSDIMPAETESNYYCVVCEFSTSSKKNLLVHMRRHNMTDQTPPTHVYSCVLCRYVNPRRRNLFQHMRKKHNIDISTQVDIAGMTEEEEAAARQDGDKMAEFIQTDHGVFTQASTEEMTTSNFESVEGSPQVLKDNLAGVANMIKIEDLTRGVTAGADGKDATSLVIDTGDGTQMIQATSLMQHKAADAIEGLQALAGQAGLIIDEEVSTLKPSRIVIEQADGEVLNATETTLPDGSIILAADQSIVEEQITIDETSSEQIQQIVESVESSDPNAGLTSLELTEEQLSSLHHGDIVQMEGQVYMVEIAQDPESPEKQLLSFLPINQG